MVKSWSRIIRLLLATLLLSVLGGCSAVKLAYNNLPELTYWWVDGYADLNEVQSLQLRADLARLHEWHRKNELPRIAELLGQIQRMAPSDTNPEQVCRLYQDVRNRFEAVVDQMLAQAGTSLLASRLSAAQLKHLEARFAKGNQEWRRDRIGVERSEQIDKRFKRELERAEQFYGTLDERQRKLLLDAVTRSAFDPQRVFAERVRRQQDMLATLRTLGSGTGNGDGNGAPAIDPALADAALRAYVERVARSPDPLYRAHAQALVLENCQTYARLHNSTTAEQRSRAGARLAAYERDARELATQR